MIKETDSVIKLIRDNADKLCARTLERLVQVINEKKAARKLYNDEHNRLEAEFNKVATVECTKSPGSLLRLLAT